MSCDISEIEGEIKGVKMAIEKSNQETARLHEMVTDMKKIKADCLAKAAKPAANSVLGRAAAWKVANPGSVIPTASHRGNATTNLGLQQGILPFEKKGGRRTRRSKTRSKRRSKMRR